MTQMLYNQSMTEALIYKLLYTLRMGCGSLLQTIQPPQDAEFRSAKVQVEQKNKSSQEIQPKIGKITSVISIDVNQSGLNQSLIKINEQEQQQTQNTLRPKYLFLFGQTQNERKIVAFEANVPQFSTLSSRSNMPDSPIKYQPSEIILEESQELFASNLYNQYSHPPYNFMYATYINEQTVFLCGGVNYKFDYISDETFLYQIKEFDKKQVLTPKSKGFASRTSRTSLMGTKFDKLNFMNSRRYSHMGAYLQTNKQGYVYVFGGRGENDEILNHCERYSFRERKWSLISPMKISRSTGFSLVYKQQIYVFGGYSNHKTRPKAIEVYHPSQNYWQQLNVQLHRGIEAGLISSVRPNEILLMGGNVQLGSLKSVIRLNLLEQTYVWQSNMKHNRLLQKGLQYENQIVVFGGDFQGTMEKYSIKEKKWRDIDLNYTQHISADCINAFSVANPTLYVNFDGDVRPKTNENSSYRRVHVFGNDNFPCILEINVEKWVLKKLAVPMTLHLRCHMNVIEVKPGKYFICGGIDSLLEKSSKMAYFYYPGTNNAIPTPKMARKKYGSAVCHHAQYVYTFGGRSDANTEYLSYSQRFNLNLQKWQQLPNLTHQRTSAKAVTINDHNIAIFGGYDIFRTISQIQIFHCKSNTFSLYKHELPIPSDVKSCINWENSEEMVIFSHNDVLQKDFAHKFKIDLGEENGVQSNGQKEQEQFQFKELNLKIPAFYHNFRHDDGFYFLGSKGLFMLSAEDMMRSVDAEQITMMSPHVLINQVQLLHYPIDKFSCPK